MRLKSLLIGVVLLLTAGATAQAAEQPPAAPWGYDTVVTPLPRAVWLDKVVMFCMPYEPPYEPDKQTIKPWAKRLQDAGFTVMGMYPDGFCRLYAPAADDTWPKECHEEVAAMHALGMKVLAGVYPFVGDRGPRDILAAHPEYRLHPDNVEPGSVGRGCMVNPGFSAALRELLAARIKEYDIDGYQFDGWYQGTYCDCDGCRTLYRQETGLDVPPKKDLLDLGYRNYMVWRDHKLFDNLVKLREAVKAVKPGFILVNWNNNDASGSAPSWMPESLDCVADWTNKEWWDAFDVYSVWLNKRLRGASSDERPPGMQPYMFMRWGKDIESGVYHGSSTPMPELMYRLHAAMAMGAVPITWPGARAGWKTEDWDDVVQAMVDFLPYVHETKTLKYAVCIDSYTSLQNARTATTNCALHEGEGKELDESVGFHRGGMARALLEEHIPFDVISEHNVTLETLSQYKVAILPNNFCISDRIAAVLREYVGTGGGLVATYETSLFDLAGQKRTDFALADLFGAHYVASAPVGPSRIGFAVASHAVTEDSALKDLMGNHGATTYWGKFARVNPDAGTMAPLTGLDVKNEKEANLKTWTPLIVSLKNKGRVAYFPAAVDAAYYDAGYPYERRLIANAIHWAAGVAPSVTVKAPMCVLTGFFTKQTASERAASSRRVIVHLLNGINTTTGHGSKDDKEFAMREEVIPIGNVKVTFAGERPRAVTLVPGNTPLNPVQRESGWEVTVPDLGLHAVVVAEYAR